MTTRSYRRHRNPQQAEGNEKPFFAKSNDQTVQTKADPFFQKKGLTIGQPGDKYEQEADNMADAVVNNSGTQPAIQQKEISSIQRESLATPQEDEKLGTAEQRMEEDKLVQEKPEEEKEVPEVQSMVKEEEQPVQKMDSDGAEEEKEEPQIQSKGEATTSTASHSVTSTIAQKQGKGKAMSPNVQAEMETKFGADFSEVNIHTDTTAQSLAKNLRAQAFTHGKDIYFNSGKYSPKTSSGKHLLAHELTHVLQQRGKRAKRVQRRVHCLKRHTSCRAPYSPGSWGAKVSYHCPIFIFPGIVLPGTRRNAWVTIPDEFIGHGPRGGRKYRCRRKPRTSLFLNASDAAAGAINRRILYPGFPACHAGYRAILARLLRGAFSPRGGGPSGIRVASARPVGRFPC